MPREGEGKGWEGREGSSGRGVGGCACWHYLNAAKRFRATVSA